MRKWSIALAGIALIALGGCADNFPIGYTTPKALTTAPPELSTSSSGRSLEDSGNPQKKCGSPSDVANCSAYAYLQVVSDALDDEASDANLYKSAFGYGALLTGLGSAISAAADASANIILGFGSATGVASGSDKISGIDAQPAIVAKGQAAIACVIQAKNVLSQPAVNPAILSSQVRGVSTELLDAIPEKTRAKESSAR